MYLLLRLSIWKQFEFNSNKNSSSHLITRQFRNMKGNAHEFTWNTSHVFYEPQCTREGALLRESLICGPCVENVAQALFRSIKRVAWSLSTSFRGMRLHRGNDYVNGTVSFSSISVIIIIENRATRLRRCSIEINRFDSAINAIREIKRDTNTQNPLWWWITQARDIRNRLWNWPCCSSNLYRLL